MTTEDFPCCSNGEHATPPADDVREALTTHACEECSTCGVHDGRHDKCCGCYDGVCCQEKREDLEVRERLYNIIRWGTENDEMRTVDRILAEVRPRGTVTDTAPTEYTIAAESANGAVTQLADYTTVVRDHLKSDLYLFRQEEERLEGDPDRIFIAERPIPKWVRS